MGKLPGINHLHAVRAFERAGFSIIRQGKYINNSDGKQVVVIPGHNPINGITLFRIIPDSGLTLEQFRSLL